MPVTVKASVLSSPVFGSIPSATAFPVCCDAASPVPCDPSVSAPAGGANALSPSGASVSPVGGAVSSPFETLGVGGATRNLHLLEFRFLPRFCRFSNNRAWNRWSWCSWFRYYWFFWIWCYTRSRCSRIIRSTRPTRYRDSLIRFSTTTTSVWMFVISNGTGVVSKIYPLGAFISTN